MRDAAVWSRYSTGPTKPMTKSRSGAAQAKNPAATRRGIERGGALADAVARATSAPDSAWVSVSKGKSENRGQTDSRLCRALLALRVLHVHLRIGAVRGRFGVAHGPAGPCRRAPSRAQRGTA